MQIVKTKFFDYGHKEISHLKQADKVLGEAIEVLGRVERIIIPDLFQALIYSIVAQQISSKAANTIWSRMQEAFGEITPKYLSSIPTDEIQKCGITIRKAGYIKSISETILKGCFNLQELYDLSDKEVIQRLSSLNGIGEWTAEMLLLNSMERPDIVSFGDIAIKRGMMNLYGLSELNRHQFNEFKNRYSPYGSVASIYLWRLSTK